MVAASISAGNVTQGLAGCRQRHLPLRPALCTRQRISCTATRGQDRKADLSNRALILGKFRAHRSPGTVKTA